MKERSEHRPSEDHSNDHGEPASIDADDAQASDPNTVDADSLEPSSLEPSSVDSDSVDSNSNGIQSDDAHSNEHHDADQSVASDDEGDTEESSGEFTEVALEDLGAAFARVAAQHHPDTFQAPEPSHDVDPDQTSQVAEQQTPPPALDEEDDDVVTPEAIVEAALFVGHPENESLSEEKLASLMRDVSPDEVVQIIDRLNESYRQADQALRIAHDDRGYRMSIAPEVEQIRRSFLGKIREARLSQMAIEVLALVAYQPGITAQKVQDQRGRDSGALLNQLVRRQLLRMERVKPEGGGRAVPHYYTTERFLHLFGLDSLEDLPHVDDGSEPIEF